MGGTDEYQNLTFILSDVHKLIHATDEKTITKYIRKLKWMNKVNVKSMNYENW